jgi:hypothetical protein
MNMNILDDVIDAIKNLFIPREKKLIPVRVPVNNKRPGSK